MQRVAVDIGGTFTDLVAQDRDGRIVVSKTLTTPHDHSEAIMTAIAKADVDLRRTEVFLHGSTIAINTVVERKGVKTALITTRGFRDVYEIGRANRPEAYNLFFQRPKPLVARSLRKEVSERMTATGAVHSPLDRDEAARVVAELKAQGVQAIAVCLLHAYANPAHELEMGEIIRAVYPDVYVSLSHQILREYREYERTSTTVINAYVGPVVSRYLTSLAARLTEGGFRGQVLIMQSNGGVMSLATARALPVRMMESGPVAGVVGATEIARRLGYDRVISFDMGGTTAKSSLVKNGRMEIASGYHVDGYATGHPVMIPVVDIVEVGSGGGSIAWIDAAGGMKVGPISAGAAPGPACYGRGGREPTVTDANLALGRLGAESFLGGEMPLDRAAAERAIADRVGERVGFSTTQAAAGILAIADAHMALSVRAVSVERGEDPRDCALVANGGAGPLHACSLARELNIPLVIVPRLPGQFSAYGMLSCDLRHDYVQTLLREFETLDSAEVSAVLDELVRGGLAVVAGEGGEPVVERYLDLRYRGQEYTIPVPLEGDRFRADDRTSLAERFNALHDSLYGHSAPSEPLELVGVRVTVRAAVPKGVVGTLPAADRAAAPYGTRPVYFTGGYVETPVFRRSDLGPGTRLDGPAIIEEPASTTVVFPGDRVQMAGTGELVIHIRREGV